MCLQAVSSLREALPDGGQQKELDAVVGQLQELHQRQLQQLNAQHLVSAPSTALALSPPPPPPPPPPPTHHLCLLDAFLFMNTGRLRQVSHKI